MASCRNEQLKGRKHADDPHKVLERLDANWRCLRRFLPDDLAAHARRSGAMANRPHALVSADTLLRLVLLWAVSGFGLRSVAAWSSAQHWARLSAPALYKRFFRLGDWLDALLAEQTELSTHYLELARRFRVVLVDATDVSGLGQSYKLHTAMDLGSLSLKQVHLDVGRPRGGETLRHFRFGPGQLVIADRIYCAAPSISHALAHQAHVLVRKRRSPRVFATPESTDAFDVLGWLQKTARGGPAERVVWMKNGEKEPIALRLIARPQSVRGEQGELEQIRRSKTRMTPEARAMAKFLVLVTTADAAALSTSQALALYRMRWQVELKFKRAKSLHNMNALPCRTPAMVRVWLLAHHLAQQLSDRLQEQALEPGRRRKQAWRSDQMAWKLVLTVLLGATQTRLEELLHEWNEALPADRSLKKTRAFERLSHACERDDASLWQPAQAA